MSGIIAHAVRAFNPTLAAIKISPVSRLCHLSAIRHLQDRSPESPPLWLCSGSEDRGLKVASASPPGGTRPILAAPRHGPLHTPPDGDATTTKTTTERAKAKSLAPCDAVH